MFLRLGSAFRFQNETETVAIVASNVLLELSLLGQMNSLLLKHLLERGQTQRLSVGDDAVTIKDDGAKHSAQSIPSPELVTPGDGPQASRRAFSVVTRFSACGRIALASHDRQLQVSIDS